MKEIKRGEVILFQKRFYIVSMSPVSNGSWKGRRVILKLLRDEELNKLIVKGLKKKLKGGLS